MQPEIRKTGQSSVVGQDELPKKATESAVSPGVRVSQARRPTGGGAVQNGV